jgi:hypothetical protein
MMEAYLKSSINVRVLTGLPCPVGKVQQSFTAVEQPQWTCTVCRGFAHLAFTKSVIMIAKILNEEGEGGGGEGERKREREREREREGEGERGGERGGERCGRGTESACA